MKRTILSLAIGLMLAIGGTGQGLAKDEAFTVPLETLGQTYSFKSPKDAMEYLHILPDVETKIGDIHITICGIFGNCEKQEPKALCQCKGEVDPHTVVEGEICWPYFEPWKRSKYRCEWRSVSTTPQVTIPENDVQEIIDRLLANPKYRRVINDRIKQENQ